MPKSSNENGVSCVPTTTMHWVIAVALQNWPRGRRANGIHSSAKVSRCPVKALKTWLELVGIGSGPLFRPISHHDQVAGEKELTPQSVALIVKAAVRRVAGDDDAAKAVASPSLRAVYCTEAVIAGLQPYQIREHTGHTSDVTLARYIRPVAKRKISSLL